MNATPSMTTTVRDSVLLAAINEAAAAPYPLKPNPASSQRLYVTQFFEVLDGIAEQRVRIWDDQNLSLEGKRAKLIQFTETAVGELQDLYERFTEGAARYTELVKGALAADPVPEQTELLNVRADARMMLDASDQSHIIQALKSAASDPEHAMRYLLLVSPFTTRYLTSRGFTAEIEAWEGVKQPLMGLTLSDTALAAYNSQDAAAKLELAGTYLPQMLEQFSKELRVEMRGLN